MEEKYFVKTTDPDTAEYLRRAGFEELPMEDDRWVFVNKPNAEYFSTEGLKMNFSNVLYI